MCSQKCARPRHGANIELLEVGRMPKRAQDSPRLHVSDFFRLFRRKDYEICRLFNFFRRRSEYVSGFSDSLRKESAEWDRTSSPAWKLTGVIVAASTNSLRSPKSPKEPQRAHVSHEDMTRERHGSIISEKKCSHVFFCLFIILKCEALV